MQEVKIHNYTCYIYGDLKKENIIIQPIDDNDFSLLDKQIQVSNTKDDYALIAIKIENWNDELSPWYMKAVFGKNDFLGNAHILLEFIKDILIKELDIESKKLYICGYSLAALFALYSAYECNIFDGVIAASPSVWFENWDQYIKERTIQTNHIYLSIGDKEENTKNPIMKTVGDRLRYQYEILNDKCHSILEYNPGNHFVDSEIRIAKGIDWMLNNQ